MSLPTSNGNSSPISPSPNYVAENLPEREKHRGLRPVRKPLDTTRLSRLIYTLVILTTLLTAFYAYRTVQYKTEVGGWWNLVLGRRPPVPTHTPQQHAPVKEDPSRGDLVEDKINDLARALGIPSRDLASAIAVAVRNYVPPASLSSIAAKETKGPAVQALLKGVANAGDGTPPTSTATQSAGAGSTGSSSPMGVVGEVVEAMHSFVGMDEPI